ncbi:cation acetate symporter [Amycolatopsis acidiphila]|uniref:Cation acetate symporter n=1 Tax=Amycolatopsis acidiphila TaxID=715473 RepID=A0A558A585_9PSEU|nr:cation acetate symporter [Amycolatopsis acidiphila]TVT19427.1 cation acetate symporter [Amycolatopsis acidiphila]UIJ56763.1 cation acetate symporter [Amycolatopsis acidiphila]GHG55264.1 cation acetate symporter [Amycolatopsis acidiphila]
MNVLAVVVVAVIVTVTLGLTSVAARRNRSTADHYVAGRRVSGWQNALALAGDQLSAASFLGITGAVALGGFSGVYLTLGIPIAYLLILLVIAEPLRNLGRFTLADAVAARFDGRLLRGVVAVASLVLSVVYMMIQFVGAGVLAQLLLGVSFPVAVIVIGLLMTLYTFVGGMVGTTYIQVFKAILLIVTVLVLFGVIMSRTGWNPVGAMIQAEREHGAAVVTPQHTSVVTGLNNVSLNIGVALGIMGLPHVMVRFLTVRDARAARKSAQLAMWIYAVFFILLPIFGYAALNEVGRDQILKDNKAGNLAAARLAEVVGGNLLFAIVVGVVMATILAVLAGLSIASSGAVAHDLYNTVLHRGRISQRRQLVVGRFAGLGISAVAIVLALFMKTWNIAFLANVAFAIAASTTMPVLVLTIYWRGFNRVGATAGLIGGLVVSVGLVIVGPDVLGPHHLFPLSIPALVSVPAGFLCAWLGSLAGGNRPGAQGVPYDELAARAFPRRRDSRPAAEPVP